MSNRRERVSEKMEAKSLEALLYDYSHIPVLAFLVGFAFWNRLRNWDNFVVNGTVFLSGNDPWYHLRMTQYTVENFPQTMPFDPWTYFPFGTSPAQFGTFMDQLIALVALIVGLGNPSESLVRHVFLVSPPFFAALVCLPAYVIGRRLGHRLGGIIIVGLIAFAPDSFLRVSMAGFVEHHVFEVLFMAVSILGVMVALTVAEEEKPVYELLASREFDAIRGTIGWSMLAGVAMAFYMWVWQPGLWIFFILSVFFLVHMSIKHVRGQSPEHAAFVGAISMLTASILQLSTLRTLNIAENVAARSPLLPTLGIASVAGVIFLAYLSRELDSRDVPQYAYPLSLLGIIIGTGTVTALFAPSVYDFAIGQFDRVFGYVLVQLGEVFTFIESSQAGGGTIGEAQPMEFSQIQDIYKLATFTAILGGAVVVVKQLLDDDPRGEELLVLVWAVLLLIASLTQVRFAYYLTIPVGALNAILVGYIISLTGTPDKDLVNVETYQVLVILVIVMVVFAPILPAVPLVGDSTTAVTYADNRSAPGDVIAWNDSLSWMNDNTPTPGQYGNPDSEAMDLYGQYKQTDDFDYPDGAYGVMSWWDYGHWITAQAERIPNANPFQEGPRDAARFLLAQDEEEALGVLSEIDESEEAQTQYVVVDWRMVETQSQPPVRGKFFAPTVFHPEYDKNDFYRMYLASQGQGQGVRPAGQIAEQPYYNSMAVRLYHYHGSAKDPEPVVFEWNQNGTFQQGGLEGDRYVIGDFSGSVEVFRNMRQARQYVRNNSNAQIGGIGAMPEERVDGLEHFRLVQMSDATGIPQSARDQRLRQEYGVNNAMGFGAQQMIRSTGLGAAYRDRLQGAGANLSNQQLNQRAITAALNTMFPNTPAFTKVFERVPGATIQGTGPANKIIQVTVTLDPENGDQFQYKRSVASDASGNFELTVPYATEGYDEFGVEEGYTNTSVRANTSYTINTRPQTLENGSIARWSAIVNVTEAQVLGEDPDPVTVELERNVFSNPIANQTGGGEQNGTQAGDGTDDGQSDGGENNETNSSATDVVWRHGMLIDPASSGARVAVR